MSLWIASYSVVYIGINNPLMDTVRHFPSAKRVINLAAGNVR